LGLGRNGKVSRKSTSEPLRQSPIPGIGWLTPRRITGHSGLLSPDLAAGIRRVKGAKKLGCRLGNWLTAEEARTLWQLPDPATLKGKRDRAILALLLGCGLRRRELTELTVDHFQRREDHWVIVDLIGKRRSRSNHTDPLVG
jgi:integrase